jgi:hypothetical protein
MKTNKTIWLLTLVLLLASCSVKKNAVSKKKTLQQKVESKDFTIYVSRCSPTDLENGGFNSDVVLKVKNDIAYANLPFHGLLNIKQLEKPMDPISFNAPMYDFVMDKTRNGGWVVTFKVKSDQYIYQVNITISSKGNVVAKVTSNERTTMTYFGNVD